MPEFIVAITAVGAVLGALAAGLGAFVTWSNSREIAAVREDLATVKGAWKATSETVNAHINAPGLHGK